MPDLSFRYVCCTGFDCIFGVRTVKSQEYVLLGRSLGESIQGRSHPKNTDYAVVSTIW